MRIMRTVTLPRSAVHPLDQRDGVKAFSSTVLCRLVKLPCSCYKISPNFGMARSYSATSGKMGSQGQETGFLGSVSRFLQRSYAADYTGFALLCVGYIFLETIAEPFHRMFSLDNIAIQFPFTEVERVPSAWNVFYAGVLPLVVLLLWALISQPGVHKAHVSILGLLVSLMLAAFLTNVVKNAVGRPRPDLIARCLPKKGTPAHDLVTFEVCTQDNLHRLHDGFRSFPSGHSSWAFSGLGYLALFAHPSF